MLDMFQFRYGRNVFIHNINKVIQVVYQYSPEIGAIRAYFDCRKIDFPIKRFISYFNYHKPLKMKNMYKRQKNIKKDFANYYYGQKLYKDPSRCKQQQKNKYLQNVYL